MQAQSSAFAAVAFLAVAFAGWSSAKAAEICFGASKPAVSSSPGPGHAAIRITYVHRDVTGITIRHAGLRIVIYRGMPRVGDVIPLGTPDEVRLTATTRNRDGCIVRFERT